MLISSMPVSDQCLQTSAVITTFLPCINVYAFTLPALITITLPKLRLARYRFDSFQPYFEFSPDRSRAVLSHDQRPRSDVLQKATNFCLGSGHRDLINHNIHQRQGPVKTRFRANFSTLMLTFFA